MIDDGIQIGRKPKRRDGRANNRPPEHSRFKPGQSGNPRGRPRGTLNYGTMLAKVLTEKVSVRVGNQVSNIPKYEALLRALFQSAMKGNVKAVQMIRDEIARLEEQPGNAFSKPTTLPNVLILGIVDNGEPPDIDIFDHSPGRN